MSPLFSLSAYVAATSDRIDAQGPRLSRNRLADRAITQQTQYLAANLVRNQFDPLPLLSTSEEFGPPTDPSEHRKQREL